MILVHQVHSQDWVVSLVGVIIKTGYMAGMQLFRPVFSTMHDFLPTAIVGDCKAHC